MHKGFITHFLPPRLVSYSIFHYHVKGVPPPTLPPKTEDEDTKTIGDEIDLRREPYPTSPETTQINTEDTNIEEPTIIAEQQDFNVKDITTVNAETANIPIQGPSAGESTSKE